MTSVHAQCWSCGASRSSADALCPACGKVQPVPPAGTPVDKFAILGFDQTFDLDLQLIEERQRALSRRLHPDKFARASSKERRFALEQTTALNDAARTMRDPVLRAQHLLALHGVDASGEDSKSVDHAFLEEAMADRERLMDAKLEGQADAVEKLAGEQREKRDAALQNLSKALRAQDWQTAAGLVQRLRYHARFLDDVEGRDRGLD